MNQQEIKAKLPFLPIEPLKGTKEIVDYQGDYLLECNSETYSATQDIALQLAIVHSINNTYSKGINPESVPDMFNALQMVVDELDGCNMSLTAKIIKDILNKATL
jgi:hypothetical protein